MSLPLPATALPAPAPPRSGWHVGPWVDGLAYHWSWVPMLLVLLTLGSAFPLDYWPLYVLVLAMNFAHQALTVRLVYPDPALRRADRRRLTVLPAALLALGLLDLFGGRARLPAMSLAARDLAVLPAAAVLLAQLDAVLRDDRPLGGLRVLAGGLVLGAAALGLALGQKVTAPAPGSVIVLGALAALSAGLTVASRARRGPSEAAPARLRVAELGAPALLAALTVAAIAVPALSDGLMPARRASLGRLLGPLAVVAYAWNFWHVYMQKYGILRLYAGKCDVPPDRRVPGWVDRLLVFGWLPLTVVLLGPPNAELIHDRYRDLRSVSGPLVAFLDAHALALQAVGAAIALAAVVAFLAYERRATGLTSAPRASFALSLVALWTALCTLDPIQVIVAFGFNHTLEYFVFVWAWQRRRSATPTSGQVGVHVLRFAVGAAVVWAIVHTVGKYVAVDVEQPRVLGRTPKDVFVILGLYLSITHFYLDGFLWKLRRPEVRALL